MNKKLIVKFAITAAFIAMPSVGMMQMGVSNASAAMSPQASAKKALGWSKKAEKLLIKGKVDEAMGFAEAAVEADMRNLEYRGLLSRVYMRQGKFTSAERTLMDVVELGQSDPRTVISLALARTAQGKVESAISLVEANRAILPASDYGLALALAGDQKRAIEVLTDAIRSDNSNARTRQNLALAFALDGRWREAQVMAAQDMPQTAVDHHIVKWASYARPGAYEVRVAGLLGVTAQADAGQPARLALNAVPAADDTQMAAVSGPMEIVVPYTAPANELAAIGPAPVDIAPVDVEAEADVAVAAAPIFEAPLIKAPQGPAKAQIKLALADTAPTAAAKSASGTHLVQLGAFSSAAGAQKAWGQFKAKYGVLQGFESASSTVTINGKKLIRIAAMGFGNKTSAAAACNAIRAKGGACMVRSMGGDAPVQMAARKPVRKAVRVASR
jgi:D-alanyl-D-alanine carboxypeptidase